MPWKRQRKEGQPLLSRNETRAVVISLLAGLILLLTFLHFGLNMFRPKKIIEKLTPPPVEFRQRSGSFGSQTYYASVQPYAHDGENRITPAPGCRNMLIVDLKFRVRNSYDLQSKLLLAEGISTVRLYGNKLAINRPCVAARDLPELWTWDEVWSNIVPILTRYFTE